MKSNTNILLLFPDQWRPDWTSANAALPLKLPNLKQLIADGAHFTNAVTSSPLCAPSRACFAMGIDYDTCPVKNNGMNLPLDAATFYQKLRAAGYHVMGCGKMDLAKPANDWGVSGTHPLPGGKTKIDAWGFTAAVDNSGKEDGYAQAKKGNLCPYNFFLKDHGLLDEHLADFSHRMGGGSYRYTEPTPLPEFAYGDNFVGEQGIALIHAVPKGEPWFLQVNFIGPHNPEDVTKEMWDPWQKTDFPAPVKGDPAFNADEHTAIRRDYAAMLENIDRWIAIYRKEIERRGETANTLVVFASDHGEMLGDHHHWGKQVPYQASMGVPMVAVGPGVKAGVVNNTPVTLVDLAATFLDVGIGNGPQFNHGHSLAPVLRGDAPSVRQVAVSGLGKWRAAYDGQWKLIRGFNPAKAKNAGEKKKKEADESEEVAGGANAGAIEDLLFDLTKDPDEIDNVAAAHPDIVARLAPFLTNPPA